MSTILEALKKSEQERNSNHLPTLSDMPVPQERSRVPLYVLIGLSLALALAIGALLNAWFTPASLTQKPPTTDQLVDSTGVSANTDKGPESQASSGDVVINVVSYSDQPSQRFVMIDGQMYREQDFVRAGLKVHAIKPDGVVLNLRGELVTRTP